jgi:uncharacterized RDD family membrane protein YckC
MSETPYQQYGQPQQPHGQQFNPQQGYGPPPQGYGPPPGYGYGQQPGFGQPPAYGPQLAGMGQRLGARILDGLIVGIPAMIVLFAIFLPLLTNDASAKFDSNGQLHIESGTSAVIVLLIDMIVFLAGAAAYEILMIAKRGATLGKQIVGIKVIKDDGSVLTTNDSAKRFAVFQLPGLVPYIGGLWVLVCALSPLFDSQRKQGFHDKAAKTLVVQAK